MASTITSNFCCKFWSLKEHYSDDSDNKAFWQPEIRVSSSVDTSNNTCRKFSCPYTYDDRKRIVRYKFHGTKLYYYNACMALKAKDPKGNYIALVGYIAGPRKDSTELLRHSKTTAEFSLVAFNQVDSTYSGKYFLPGIIDDSLPHDRFLSTDELKEYVLKVYSEYFEAAKKARVAYRQDSYCNEIHRMVDSSAGLANKLNLPELSVLRDDFITYLNAICRQKKVDNKSCTDYWDYRYKLSNRYL